MLGYPKIHQKDKCIFYIYIYIVNLWFCMFLFRICSTVKNKREGIFFKINNNKEEKKLSMQFVISYIQGTVT